MEASAAANSPPAHAVHDASFDAAEYLPAAHAVHMLAPPLAPVFVIEPGGHIAQSIASLEPVVPTYRPAAQLEHAATFDAVEYLPTAHGMHVVAPVLAPASVIEPAAQSLHDATLDFVENLPAAHGVHELAPAAVPVLVVEPATQSEQ